jgi:hypothetical protein
MVFYIPALRWKRGERVGLRQVSSAGRTGVIPLIMLSDDQFKAKEPTSSRAGMSAEDVFVSEVVACWGKATFYLDASTVPVSGGRHPILRIAASARAAGAMMIPATRLDAPPAYQQAVATICAQDKRGVCLRVDLQEFTTASGWVSSWIASLHDTDLIVDFNSNVATISSLGSSLEHAFASLHQAAQWRTVAMMGSAMPGNFSGFQAGLHTVRREEVRLWRRIARVVTNYPIHFGDYATVSPNAAPAGIAWGFPINVRYTLAQDFLICRGVSTTGLGAMDMDIQLLNHAQSIGAYPGRNPLPTCWADQKVDRIGAQTERPGNLETWVQIGVNRHIEFTRAQLP